MRNIILTILLLSACSSFDTTYATDSFCSAKDCYEELERHHSSKEGDRNAHIGFVEFNDHGFQKDPNAVLNILSNINELNRNSSTSPLLIVAFIHGWHHNANPEDSNVKSFKEFLVNLQYEEDNLSFSNKKRQVVGVYIGWRGESNDGLFSVLTYRTRKLAGLRVGEYGLQEVLAELNVIRESNQNNRLVSIGHSFGGGVLYSSVMQKLVDSVVSAKLDESNNMNTIVDKAYGDIVILMNPALEAARVEVLNRRLSRVEKFNTCQPLALVSFTSEYDEALSKIFPMGQKIFFKDDLKIAKSDKYEQLVTTSYGNQVSYRTNELICENCKLTSASNFLTASEYRSAANEWTNFRNSKNAKFSVGQITLSHLNSSQIKPGSPILNVYVKGDNIIKDHNTIWGSDFSKFARALIGMEFAKQNKCNL